MTQRGQAVESARDRLARHLRALRRQQGISQEALADRCELHRTYVGSIERRERNVSLDNVERLAHALGVDISELLAPG
jgi:transcriptional regulator with XRE-family HTH domain